MSADAIVPSMAEITGVSDLPMAGPCVKLGGRRLVLLPQHAVWDVAARTVMVSDLHLGKEATFRALAIPVPDQTCRTLDLLTKLLSLTDAVRLIILGDLLHARRGRCEQMMQQVTLWRQRHSSVRMELVRGNHDVASGDPPEEWQMTCFSEPFACQRLQLCHDPKQCEGPGVAGHLHPVVRLRGRGRDSLRLPCFLLRDEVLVLPAFSRFVDGRVLQAGAADQIFVVSEQSVISIH